MKHHKKFDVYCDKCGQVSEHYDTFNDWQEHEEDTISLTICKSCQYEDRKNSPFEIELRRRIKKYWEEKEKEKNIDKSVDKRKGVCYTISKMLRKGS